MAKHTFSRESFDGHMLPIRNRKIFSGEEEKTLRTNAVHRNTYVDPGSLRSHHEYDHQSNSYKEVHADIIDSAIKHMAKLKTKTVTSARLHPEPHDPYGYPFGGCMAAPTVANKSKHRKKKR